LFLQCMFVLPFSFDLPVQAAVAAVGAWVAGAAGAGAAAARSRVSGAGAWTGGLTGRGRGGGVGAEDLATSTAARLAGGRSVERIARFWTDATTSCTG
jgi:hypothetical protein